ncbi:GAP family protein [Paenibacillus sp. EC2-1]|uniref:GAP family protein n=1 Tax=Paenibacillus sp. EC2-1 TaxID=3388665 RepID=UPI003BEEE6BD
MSIELLLSVGALALLDMVSPATIGVTLYLLLSDRNRIFSRLMMYLMTVAGFYFIVGISLMLGMDYIFDAASNMFQNRVISWITAVVGGVLFIASFYVPTKKTAKPVKPKSLKMSAMISLGVTTSLLEVATALPYFAAIGLMTTAQLTIFQWLPILATYNFIMILPPLLLIGLHALFGRLLQKPLEKLSVKIANSTGSVLSWMMCIAGIILLLNSIDHL